MRHHDGDAIWITSAEASTILRLLGSQRNDTTRSLRERLGHCMTSVEIEVDGQPSMSIDVNYIKIRDPDRDPFACVAITYADGHALYGTALCKQRGRDYTGHGRDHTGDNWDEARGQEIALGRLLHVIPLDVFLSGEFRRKSADTIWRYGAIESDPGQDQTVLNVLRVISETPVPAGHSPYSTAIACLTRQANSMAQRILRRLLRSNERKANAG